MTGNVTEVWHSSQKTQDQYVAVMKINNSSGVQVNNDHTIREIIAKVLTKRFMKVSFECFSHKT